MLFLTPSPLPNPVIGGWSPEPIYGIKHYLQVRPFGQSPLREDHRLDPGYQQTTNAFLLDGSVTSTKAKVPCASEEGSKVVKLIVGSPEIRSQLRNRAWGHPSNVQGATHHSQSHQAFLNGGTRAQTPLPQTEIGEA